MSAPQVLILTEPSQWEEAISVFSELERPLDLEKAYKFMSDSTTPFLKTLGLEVNNQIIGAACVYLLPILEGKSICWIFDLAIRKEFSGRGFGTVFFREIELFAAAQGCVEVRVHSRNHRSEAHDFYRSKCGFSDWCVLLKKELDATRSEDFTSLVSDRGGGVQSPHKHLEGEDRK
jgi:GNAT superfamily N-acetyltransferase